MTLWASRALLAEVAALVLVDRRYHVKALMTVRMVTRLATWVAMAKRSMMASLAAMASMGLEDRVDPAAQLAIRAEGQAGDPRCRAG